MEVSVVIPVFNERENLRQLHTELGAAMARLGKTYEVIYVDDGSSDGSRDVLRRIHEEDPHVRLLVFRRNFGQTAAVAAGFGATRGDIVVTLDGDLQNDPADIPMLVAKLEEGYDLVSGWRRDRKDVFLHRRLPSLVANWFIRLTTNVRVHDYGCMLKVYRGDIARSLRLYGEMHRFIPAIAGDMGARIAEMVVNHRPRVHGISKYGLSRVVRVVLDLLTVKFLSVFSTRPIHVFGTFGVALSGVGGLLLAWLGGQRLLLRRSPGESADRAARHPAGGDRRAVRHARASRRNARAHLPRKPRQTDLRAGRGPRRSAGRSALRLVG